MPQPFNSLPAQQQQNLRNRYAIPTDTTDVGVNAHGQPYEQTESGRFVCAIRRQASIDGGFHTHGDQRKDRVGMLPTYVKNGN